MKLLIKFPTRERPEKFFTVLDLYYKKLRGTDYEFIITCDIDDNTMNNDIIKNRLNSYSNLVYYFGCNNSKVEAINSNLEKHNFDILLLASDDMIPVKDGFDIIIKEKMRENFPDTDGVLWFNDGFQGPNLNTLCIIGKKYYDRFNYIYNPQYKSLYCDTEFTAVSNILNKVKYFDEIIITHQQYSIINEVPDKLYIKNDGFESRDKKVFLKRKELKFPLPFKSITHKYFIFVHDIDLIEFLEHKKKFNHLENYQYVLLSNHENVIETPKIIIAEKCRQNIEKFNNYLQFTGWFCLAANKFTDTDYITLLEYDVDTDIHINEIINTNILKDQLECYGYANLPKTNSFLNNDIFSSLLVKFCEKEGIEPSQIIQDNLETDWIVTSNITIKTSTFLNLIRSNFFIKFLNFLQNDKFSGHSLERMLTVLLTLNNIPYRTIEKDGKSVILHHAFDSHNTQGRNHLYKNYKNIL